MSEMIEKIALAIWAVEEAEGEPGSRSDHPIWRLMARAAIAAMREPTPNQGLAMYAAWDKFGEDAIMGPEEALAIYQAAIDAALKDE